MGLFRVLKLSSLLPYKTFYLTGVRKSPRFFFKKGVKCMLLKFIGVIVIIEIGFKVYDKIKVKKEEVKKEEDC